MRKTLIILAALAFPAFMFPATFTVNSLANTNTGSGSSGTLRWCLNMVTITPGAPHTINFAVAGTIAIVSDANALPAVTQACTIDATTAPGYAGSPVVSVDYTGCVGSYGLQINAANVTVLGLEIHHAPYMGISVAAAANSFRIGNAGAGCVIRNSGYYGIQVNGADNGYIQACRIGTNAAGTACEPNDYDGIDLNSNANNNQILGNHIACNGYNGLQIGNSHNNTVKGNVFGPLMGSCTSNGYRGVDLEGGSHDNIIGGTASGEPNKIAGNLYWGLEVKESGTVRNMISGNSFSCNDYGAIEVNTGGNNNIAAPVITAASGTTVSGTSAANATIEVFRAFDGTVFGCAGTPVNQGADYLGTTTATAGGTWTLSGTFSGSVVATQTTAFDGTSMFSARVSTGVPAVWVNSCAGFAVGSGCTPPAAPTNTTPPPALLVCSGGSTTLSASGTGVLGWYTAASGGTYLGGGSPFSTGPLSGTTTFYVQDSTCDRSATRTAITVNVTTLSSTQSPRLCDGESLTVGASTYSTSGTYVDTLTTVAGCDSVVTTILTVDPPIATSLSFVLCAGETVTIGGSTYSASGSYTDVLTAANGCDSTITTDLTVRAPIDVSTTLIGTSINANAFADGYQWLDCDADTLLTGETSQDYLATFSGNFAVIITDSGCTDTSACVNVIVVGTQDAIILPTVYMIWPQPVTDGFLNVEAPGCTHFTLLDLLGRTVASAPLSDGVNRISIPPIAAGHYFIQLSSPTVQHQQRILIE